MTDAPAAAPPADAASTPLAARRGFVRLGEEAWAQIRSEYLAGATGKQIAQKWGCSRVSVYDHAYRGGWTKRAQGRAVSATVLETVRAEREERAARAAAPPPEASPLLAAGLLLRQAAAAALMGASASAFEGLKLAESLARCARLVSEAEHGVAQERAALLAQAMQGLEDDPDYTPPGWREGEESQALDATILTGLAQLRRARGRSPPQHLPLWFMLEDHEALRPLAQALGLVAEGRAWVECRDFEAAVAKARAEGRGEAVDAALCEPTPLEHCVWLSAEEKAAVASREAQAAGLADAAAAEVAGGLGWAGDEAGEAGEAGAQADGAAEAPVIQGLCEADDPWRRLQRPRPGRLSTPYTPISEG